MKKHQRNSTKSKSYIPKLQNSFNLKNLISVRSVQSINHFKPRLRANGSTLLPLALRPGLFVLLGILGTFLFQNSYTSSVSAASMTLTLPPAISLDVADPSANGGFNKSSVATISMKTDASSGYTLSIKSKNNNELTNTTLGSSKLTSISSNLSEEQFKSMAGVNTWGYLPSKLNSKDNTNFLPGPTTQSSVIEETSKANNDTANNYDITLASKVNNTTPSGTYSNTFILTATANKPKTMQDFTCDLRDGETVTLTDARDGKTYTVARLKDGKCWMTQNLAIGSNDQETELTPEDSDVGENFTLSQGSTIFDDYSKTQIYITPEPDLEKYGGYYSDHAATADSDYDLDTDQMVNHSICPKGWGLPTAKDLALFFAAYGGEVRYDPDRDEYMPFQAKPTDSAILGSAPANFTLAGKYDSDGSPYDQKSKGYYRSQDFSFVMRIKDDYSAEIYEDGGLYSEEGFSVRCIYRHQGEIVEYTITYEDNDGNNGPGVQSGKGELNGLIYLEEKAPTKEGYVFKGWCTDSNIQNNNTLIEPSCSGTAYQPGDSYRLSNGGEITLYAMWLKMTQYSINYDLQGGSGGPSPNPQTGFTTDSDIILDSTNPTKTNYFFSGWCSKIPNNNSTHAVSCPGDTYDHDVYPVSRGAVTTLYAIWEDPCPTTVATCSHNGYSGKRFGNGKCWMDSDYQNSVTWSNTSCPSGWNKPSKADFEELISPSQAGAGGCLAIRGWNGSYWSSTSYGYDTLLGADSAYSLQVWPNQKEAKFVYGPKTNKDEMRCYSN